MEVKFYDTNPILREHTLMFAYAELSIEEISKTKFLPDNASSLTLFLNINPTVTDYYSGNTLNHRITFSGQYTIPVLYTPQERIKIINIDFLPWGAYSIFGIEQNKLHNVTSNALDIFPNLNKYIVEIEANLDNPDLCVNLLENFLIEELKQRQKIADPRIIKACNEISAKKSNVQIKELSENAGMSHNSFTNHFTKIIGVNPKLFCRVARFTAVQIYLGENPEIGWNEIAYQFDFYDQNHFIREFKSFTGAIPKDRKHWEALFDPLSSAIKAGFKSNPQQMKIYIDTSLYQILHNIN